MSGGEVGGFVVLAVVLLLLGVFYFGRQVRALGRLRTTSLPDEEMQYSRRQVRWRLVSSVLLMVLGVLLLVALVFLEQRAHAIAERARELRAEGGEPIYTPDEKLFLKVWGGFWIGFLLILLVVVVLAGLDLWATRRFGLREHRRLQADRRAMIERQVHRLRQERNERN